MPRISPFLWATAVLVTAGASAFAMPFRAPSSPDIGAPEPSFSVFFDPGAASLSKEGREIISVAAKRFEATHNRHSAARVIVTSESDDQENASLSNKRIKAISQQLMRDGIQGKYVSAVERPSGHLTPLSLRSWQHRCVSISIHENGVIARL